MKVEIPFLGSIETVTDCRLTTGRDGQSWRVEHGDPGDSRMHTHVRRRPSCTAIANNDMDAAADAVILCIAKIYRARPAHRRVGEGLRWGGRDRTERMKREKQEGAAGGQGTTNVYYIRYNAYERERAKRREGREKRDACVR